MKLIKTFALFVLLFAGLRVSAQQLDSFEQYILERDTDHLREYLPAAEQSDFRIFSVYDMNLQDWRGDYVVDTILDGQIDVTRYGLDDISKIKIKMSYNKDTQQLHIFSNFPGNREHRIPYHFKTSVQIVAADGHGRGIGLNLHFTNKGILLSWWDFDNDRGYRDSAVIRLKSISHG
jgi:hypothetical protein